MLSTYDTWKTIEPDPHEGEDPQYDYCVSAECDCLVCTGCCLTATECPCLDEE